MAAEVRRCAAKGCHAVSFSENPSKLKLPSFHDEHWDPFWQACVDEGTIVCLHIGSSSRLVITAPDAPIDVLITLQPINIVQAAADLCGRRCCASSPTCGSRCPRAASAGSRTSATASTGSTPATTPGPARTSVAGCRARCSSSGSCSASSTTRPASANLDRMDDRPASAGRRLPALRLDVADLARDAVAVDRRTPRRRDRQDHPRERDAPLPLRPVRPSPATSAPSARCGRGATDVDVTPRSVAPRAEPRPARPSSSTSAKRGSVERLESSTRGHRRRGDLGLPAACRTGRSRRCTSRRPTRALADAGLGFDDVDGYATVGYFPMYCVGMCEYLGIHPALARRDQHRRRVVRGARRARGASHRGGRLRGRAHHLRQHAALGDGSSHRRAVAVAGR